MIQRSSHISSLPISHKLEAKPPSPVHRYEQTTQDKVSNTYLYRSVSSAIEKAKERILERKLDPNTIYELTPPILATLSTLKALSDPVKYVDNTIDLSKWWVAFHIHPNHKTNILPMLEKPFVMDCLADLSKYFTETEELSKLLREDQISEEKVFNQFKLLFMNPFFRRTIDEDLMGDNFDLLELGLFLKDTDFVLFLLEHGSVPNRTEGKDKYGSTIGEFFPFDFDERSVKIVEGALAMGYSIEDLLLSGHSLEEEYKWAVEGNCEILVQFLLRHRPELKNVKIEEETSRWEYGNLRV